MGKNRNRQDAAKPSPAAAPAPAPAPAAPAPAPAAEATSAPAEAAPEATLPEAPSVLSAASEQLGAEASGVSSPPTAPEATTAAAPPAAPTIESFAATLDGVAPPPPAEASTPLTPAEVEQLAAPLATPLPVSVELVVGETEGPGGGWLPPLTEEQLAGSAPLPSYEAPAMVAEASPQQPPSEHQDGPPDASDALPPAAPRARRWWRVLGPGSVTVPGGTFEAGKPLQLDPIEAASLTGHLEPLPDDQIPQD